MSKIIPTLAGATYKIMLQRHLKENNLQEGTPEHAVAIAAFEAGWHSSKAHTFDILESISQEDTNGRNQ